MTEDKQKICDLLLQALNATRDGYDISSLEYKKHDGLEIVEITFDAGTKLHANVTYDSGIAMIRDIVRQL